MVWSPQLRFLSPATRESLNSLRQRVRARFVGPPYSTVLPYTMVGLDRLRKLRELIRHLDEEGVAGDIVECGTYNGGSGALLAHAASQGTTSRHTWLLDSFQGMPTPSRNDGESAKSWTGTCRGSAESVREVLAKLEVPANRVTIVPGWFSDTLSTIEPHGIALLHIDADWYESVLEVLEELFEQIVPGGFVVLDDYGYWQGCKLAWTEFCRTRNLSLQLIPTDDTGAYARVPFDQPTAST